MSLVTTLYIVRHCQSAGNLSGRFQGRFDAPVSETGEKQLELLSLRFRNEHLDAIYTSPLSVPTVLRKPSIGSTISLSKCARGCQRLT